MENKKVSVIIPAYNEEDIIQKTIKSYKVQDYRPLEVIVVVNNSNDRTYDIAGLYADKVLNFPGPIGVCAARNEGAKVAAGEVLIFSDADSYLEPGSVRKIVQAISGKNVLGTLFGKEDKSTFSGRLFFLFKNWTHKLKIYQGIIDGVLFCHRELFFKVGGFDETKKIAEFEDFLKRAKKQEAKYKLLSDCYTVTSLRRYERKGYIKAMFFWIKWKFMSYFSKNKKLTKEYFKK